MTYIEINFRLEMGENFRLTQHYEKPASFMSEVYGECMVIRSKPPIKDR